MKKPSPYLMRDFNNDKIGSIMAFNVAERQSRSRSILEVGLFLCAVVAYLSALAAAA